LQRSVNGVPTFLRSSSDSRLHRPRLGLPVAGAFVRGQAVLPELLERFQPRTVLARDDQQVWLITLEGAQASGPSLGETALLLQQLGLRDAVNLDGGSSTGLVLGGSLQVKGRGVAGSVHNGVGLVP